MIRLMDTIQSQVFKMIRAPGDTVFLDKFLELSRMLLRKLRKETNEVAALTTVRIGVAKKDIQVIILTYDSFYF